MTGNFQTEV